MPEQNGRKIVITQLKKNILGLPSISPPLYHQYHSSQTKLNHSKLRKLKSKKFKAASLDQAYLRECCKRRNQVDKINLTQVKAKKKYFIAINKRNNQSDMDIKNHRNCKNHMISRKKRILTYDGETQPKKKIYFLPNSQQFDPQDIRLYCNIQMDQKQTQHKVNSSKSRRKLIEQRDKFTKNNNHLKQRNQLQFYQHRYNLNQRTDNKQLFSNYEIPKNSYIDIDEEELRKKYKQTTKGSSEKDDTGTNLTKRYYRHIENNKKEDDNFVQNRKVTIFINDQQKQDSLFSKSQIRENSTIFHTNKLKFGSSLKQSLMKNSKILFKEQFFQIPQTQEEQTQFLLKYKPLDPDFNLRSLVGKQNFKILDRENKMYFGLVKGQQKHGLGILISQKQLFEGQFISDKKFKGIQKTKQGIYIGAFVNEMREGKAKFIWKNGQEFQGEWKNGKKEGLGTWKSPKGDFYQGGWKNNKQNGRGLFVHKGGSKYVGQFKNFLKHGKGEQEFANGDKYTGQYKEGKPHGFGKYIWVNGDIYKGQFIQGSRQGKGILTKSNSENYQGYFENDLKQGQGKQIYSNGYYFQGYFEKDAKIKGKLYNKQGTLLSQLN